MNKWIKIAAVALAVAAPSTAAAGYYDADRSTVRNIHLDVNWEIKYTSDKKQYGVTDKWVVDPASKKGDCEDYAVTKRAKAIAAGIAPDRLKLIMFISKRYATGHLVLMLDDKHVYDNVAKRSYDNPWSGKRMLKFTKYGFNVHAVGYAVVPNHD